MYTFVWSNSSGVISCNVSNNGPQKVYIIIGCVFLRPFRRWSQILHSQLGLLATYFFMLYFWSDVLTVAKYKFKLWYLVLERFQINLSLAQYTHT